MPSGSSSRSAMEIALTKLSSPRIFLVRMLVFLVLCALVAVVLYKQIVVAFGTCHVRLCIPMNLALRRNL